MLKTTDIREWIASLGIAEDVPSDNRSCVMHQNHHNPYREIPLQWDEMLSAHNASV